MAAETAQAARARVAMFIHRTQKTLYEGSRLVIGKVGFKQQDPTASPRTREGKMLQGFKQFMLRGNVLDLAVAVGYGRGLRCCRDCTGERFDHAIYRCDCRQARFLGARVHGQR